MRKRTATVVVVSLAITFFFFAPVVYHNPMNFAGNAEEYESMSCALFNVGISYGHQTFLGGNWVLRPFCYVP